MFARRMLASIIIIHSLAIAGSVAIGAPDVTITSPADNSILLANSVNVTGTAAGSDAQWVQTDKADFDAGAMENITSNAGGNVSLNASIYDDFNDNSLDSNRWTWKNSLGVSVSEQNGMMTFSGKSTTNSYWAAGSEMDTTQSIVSWVSADITSYSGTRSGHNADMMLNQDSNNEAGLAFDYDSATGPNPIMHWTYWSGGVEQQVNLGVMTACPHTARLEYTGGMLSVYLDGSPLHSGAVSLTNTKLRIYSCARISGDTVSVTWDNVKSGFTHNGSLSSAIYDTLSSDPVLRKVGWNAETPSGTTVSVQLRSSDLQDMSSPTPWAFVSNGQTTALPAAKRYIQYKAVLTSSDGYSTPVFKDITVDYHKPVKKVDVSIDGKASWVSAIGTEKWYALVDLPENQTTIWVRVTDVAGETGTASVTVDVDTTPPTGAININNGDEFAPGRNVNISCNAKDKYGVASVLLSQDRLFSDAEWASYSSSVPFTLSEGDGVKTVFAKFRDVHGLESLVVNDSIILDTTPPKGSVVIGDGEKFTRNTNVTLALNATDASGVEDMKVSDYKDLAGEDWQPFKTTLQWEFAPGSGERTIYVIFRSTLGQESEIVSHSIILDTLAPTMGVVISGEAAYTNTTSVTLLLNATDNYRVASMEISNDPAFQGSAPEQFSEEKSWTLSPGDGEKTVYARAVDAAGNIGRAGNASIILDTTPPVCAISQLPLTVNTTDFGVNWSGTDPTSGISFFDVQYSDGGGAWTDWLLRTNLTRATFSGSDGHDYSFRARAQDRVGNIGAYPDTGSMQVQVRLPPPPKPPVVAISRPLGNSTLKGTADITGTSYHPEAGMTVRSVLIRVDGGSPQQVNGTASWSFVLDTRALADGRHTLTAQAFDGTRYSDNATTQFLVNNHGGGLVASSNDMLPWLAVLAVVIIVLGSVALLALRRIRTLP